MSVEITITISSEGASKALKELTQIAEAVGGHAVDETRIGVGFTAPGEALEAAAKANHLNRAGGNTSPELRDSDPRSFARTSYWQNNVTGDVVEVPAGAELPDRDNFAKITKKDYDAAVASGEEAVTHAEALAFTLESSKTTKADDLPELPDDDGSEDELPELPDDEAVAAREDPFADRTPADFRKAIDKGLRMIYSKHEDKLGRVHALIGQYAAGAKKLDVVDDKFLPELLKDVTDDLADLVDDVDAAIKI